MCVPLDQHRNRDLKSFVIRSLKVSKVLDKLRSEFRLLLHALFSLFMVIIINIEVSTIFR